MDKLFQQGLNTVLQRPLRSVITLIGITLLVGGLVWLQIDSQDNPITRMLDQNPTDFKSTSRNAAEGSDKKIVKHGHEPKSLQSDHLDIRVTDPKSQAGVTDSSNETSDDLTDSFKENTDYAQLIKAIHQDQFEFRAVEQQIGRMDEVMFEVLQVNQLLAETDRLNSVANSVPNQRIVPDLTRQRSERSADHSVEALRALISTHLENQQGVENRASNIEPGVLDSIERSSGISSNEVHGLFEKKQVVR